ncbi:MAG TPA: hypothetical protein VK711_01055 [Puia sp.]|nr:hypothetical protein [Puia sp.]
MAIKATFPNRWGKNLLLITLIFISALNAYPQVIIRGTVYSHKDGIPLSGVSVLSVSGAGTMTDSLGYYSLRLASDDSIYFSWLGKITDKFVVRNIPPNEPFNLNIDEVNVRLLPSFAFNGPKDYLMDSINNRSQYQKVFGYETKSGPQEKNANQTDGVGLGWDMNSLLSPSADNRTQALQQRMIETEKDKYIDHRFNSALVKKITGLEPPALDNFMKVYRPSYESLQAFETEYEYFQWISDSAKTFRDQWNRAIALRLLPYACFIW